MSEISHIYKKKCYTDYKKASLYLQKYIEIRVKETCFLTKFGFLNLLQIRDIEAVLVMVENTG